MPYAEFRQWQIYYAIEPFGWHDAEYHTASILAMLYNVNRGKGKAKEAKDFVRNMVKAVLSELKEQPRLEDMTPEQVKAQIKKDFGI